MSEELKQVTHSMPHRISTLPRYSFFMNMAR